MNYLKRLLAMLLGVTVLPARAIYHGFEFGVAALAIGAAALLGVPVFVAYFLRAMRAAWPLNVLLTTLAIPATAVVVALGLAFAVPYIIYTTAVDVFKMAWSGLKSGFVDGLDGFRRIWNNQRSPVERISNYVRAYYNGVSVENQINNEDAFNALQMNLVDVPRQPLEVPDLQSPLLHHTDLLTRDEINAAEQLLKDVATIGIPLSPDLKGKVQLFSTKKTNYQDLLTRMELVQDALLNDNPSAINDELMSMEITTPLIIFKQYQTPDNVWHSVPANSYVTDRENLLTWLREKSTHPLNNDVIMSPPPYEGMPTRYKWDVLTTKNCFLALELQEGAATIRDLLSTLPAQLVAAKQNPSSPGSTPQTLFRTDSSAIGQKPQVDEQLNPLTEQDALVF
ncbi:hypothetical protein [Legionella maioricensis]|uniref:Coiled coil protein n=1 Tax=Legionella maioricensis TaxID=2896528 RepID=A0A9X2D207_9GAMM|nr:hypothetical protein [Legionella maioricensis]MCL9684753.1 hypothetical protein [Legionella maioricensis]MCL9687845.1 hypothetical protein [Legionella maioricensis]